MRLVLFGNEAVVLFVTLLLLTACGGGGDGKGTTAPTASGDGKDTTAPTVSSVSPAPGATDVAPEAVISAIFDENILGTSVDGSSFTLRDETGAVTGTASFDGVGNVATWTPARTLSLLRTYTATLSTAIADLAGNGLAANYSWSFTTRDGAWQVPQLIDTDDPGGAFAPQIAFDAVGNALAVWSQFDGVGVRSSRYTVGSGWGTAELIETGDDDNDVMLPFAPQIAFDAAGNALAVWDQLEGPRGNIRSNIWSNRYTIGSGWGIAELIETDDTGSAGVPQIAFDAAGNALAVWDQSDGHRYSIWSNRYTVGSGWGEAKLIETDNAGDAYLPQIAFDAAGNALAVWDQSDGIRYNIWSNRYTVGSGWGTAELIETDDAGDALTPQIALNAAGNALAVWTQSDGTRDSIWSSRYTVGSGWGTPVLIETDDAGSAIAPQIALDAAGNALAVWTQSDGTCDSITCESIPRDNIWSNHYTVGSGWGAAGLIETDDTGNASSPQIALDAAGNALAVWTQSDGTRDNIWSNRYTVGSGWGTAELIETDDAGDATAPQIALDTAGNALAVWYLFDGIQNHLWSNRFE